MLIFAIICNVLITLVNLYVLRKILKIRRYAANLADRLTVFEQHTHKVLEPAPQVVSQGKKGTRQLKEKYQKLELQLLQIQKLLQLLRVINSLSRFRLIK